MIPTEKAPNQILIGRAWPPAWTLGGAKSCLWVCACLNARRGRLACYHPEVTPYSVHTRLHVSSSQAQPRHPPCFHDPTTHQSVGPAWPRLPPCIHIPVSLHEVWDHRSFGHALPPSGNARNPVNARPHLPSYIHGPFSLHACTIKCPTTH